jgi:phthiodiolone/phenolphthiodiolone dimycocerosates ketoreductase
MIQRVRYCEQQGFDSVHIDDHLLYGTGEAAAPEPFTTLASLAAHTKTIRLGILVTDLVRRHPAIVAQATQTLATIAPRRVFLGLGTGDVMNQAPFGLPTQQHYSRLKEGLKVIRRLWESSITKPVNFNGHFYNLTNAYLQAGQEDPRVPVYLAAFGDKMLRLVGREADGWVPHCHIPKTYRTDLEKIHASARSAGRKPNSIIPGYYTLASVAKTREEADRRVLGPARYFLALIPEALRKVDPSTKHPGRIWEKMTHPREQRDTIRKIAATIPEKVALDTVIHGTPEDAISQITEFQKAGCRELMLTFASVNGLWSAEGLLPSIKFFSERVQSQFSDKTR